MGIQKWSLKEFIKTFDVDDQKSPEISMGNDESINFQNCVPIERLKNLVTIGDDDSDQKPIYEKVEGHYVCGLNAINMSLAIWGYNKQMKKSQYAYKWVIEDKEENRFGMYGAEMYVRNIKPTFDTDKCHYNVGGGVMGQDPGINISYIDDTEYYHNTLMLVTGKAKSGHYIMIIGVSDCKRYYLVTDHSGYIWFISYSKMKNNDLFHYDLSSGGLIPNLVSVRSYYRLG